MKKPQTSAFTIVELLIVIVVIGILATIVVVAFNGVQRSAAIASLQSELKQASTKLELAKVDATDGNYPSSLSAIGITDTDSIAFRYNRINPNGYCITVVTTAQANIPPYYLSSTNQEPTEGLCDGHTNPNTTLYLQNITAANCPTTRTLATDARDNHTYWVQKITGSGGYSECWMLTNLAYAGGTSNGGVETYGDVKEIDQSAIGNTYNEPRYYAHADANPSTHPIEPSINNVGGGATAGGERQYGYLYNWCAAMGAQTSTTACTVHATLPALPNQSVSICPANWKLPTGIPATGSLQLLANAVGAANDAAGSTALESVWLAQLGGRWVSGLGYQGSFGYFWSSSQDSASHAYGLYYTASNVYPDFSIVKYGGHSVRCLVAT